ncbi:hypothetical protein C8R45DRAFT_1061849 [Mycena sanguinolenta]|nr:hypothetical protein C8R45DRAFT_1061849 [Mycena sanguinolenta]
MAPAEYFLRLQRSITGGFAPPTPSASYTLTQSPAQPNTIAVTLVTRQDRAPSTPCLRPHPIEELHGILKTLPLEDPRGSEDIYGLDTSIMWGARIWSGEEKNKFKRAVDIVGELVERAEKEG